VSVCVAVTANDVGQGCYGAVKVSLSVCVSVTANDVGQGCYGAVKVCLSVCLLQLTMWVRAATVQ